MSDAGTCTHLGSINLDVARSSDEGCSACLRIGGWWVHLRECMTCGEVGCCDNSPNKHATHHHLDTRHPIVRSIEPGEKWFWCYDDEMGFTEFIPPKAAPGESGGGS